ncbi:helix-turn-helix transcriptional regulator [Phenylobacterium sp.]|uniref:helix-turn-helix domain-containing protein n=1 Tax=Phenylobacterium sp. TaxID=1871053 RepID=UPI00286D771C|nr:helix-turn-helix transcriptional regulator [Phenylobacterium sp.]
MTYRAVDAGDWIAQQPKAIQEIGEALGQELIREVTLREVREAVKRTQVEVAAAMGASQDRVSKLEHSDDALVSTLRRHVRALGGELRLMVEFPDRPSMAIDLKGDKPVSKSVRAI